MKLSIIIPVYNEEQTIGTVVERVRAVDLGDIEREIIVANDGSDDGTQRVIDATVSANAASARVSLYNMSPEVSRTRVNAALIPDDVGVYKESVRGTESRTDRSA